MSAQRANPQRVIEPWVAGSSPARLTTKINAEKGSPLGLPFSCAVIIATLGPRPRTTWTIRHEAFIYYRRSRPS
jgi:hypothetical protein